VECLRKSKKWIDISKNKTKSAFDFVKQGMLFHYVVTVCEESSQKCPIFPRIRERVIMSFEDPSSFVGSDKEILEKTRNVKNQIKQEVLHFIELVKRGELKTNFPKNWKLG